MALPYEASLEQGWMPALYRISIGVQSMKYLAIVVSVMLGSYSLALAQGGASGRGSVTGDPAASSANPSTDPNATTGMSPSSSGSGTSTSGGKDENGDQGRDKAPGSGMAVKPRDQQQPQPK
jgi:hypothetical protein